MNDSDQNRNDPAARHDQDEQDDAAGKAVMNDPTDTDHPTGVAQAAENAATESPS